jgi:hypothetical protein
MATNQTGIRKPPKRVVIYTQDIMAFTGKSPNTARRMLATVREVLGKKPESLVTIPEFAVVWEIDPELIEMFIR